jgi:hypothetical protein
MVAYITVRIHVDTVCQQLAATRNAFVLTVGCF